MAGINLAKKYVPVLDEIYKKESLTAILDGADNLAREGANAHEILVQKLSLQGLADYSKSSGYTGGSIDLDWETLTTSYDRGRMFTVDAVDEKEAMGYFGNVAKEFIRTKVAPELDAVRIATIAGTANIGGTTGTLSTGADVIAALRVGTSTLDEAEAPDDDRVLFITPTLLGLVEDLDTTKSREVLSRFQTVVRMPQTRFYSVIDLYDGTTAGETAGGYIKDASTGKDMNFLIVSKSAICQFKKHVAPKIVTPEANQTADAWKYGYRIVSLTQVYSNKVAGVYSHHKA